MPITTFPTIEVYSTKHKGMIRINQKDFDPNLYSLDPPKKKEVKSSKKQEVLKEEVLKEEVLKEDKEPTITITRTKIKEVSKSK